MIPNITPIAQLDSAGNIEATFIYGTRAHVPDAMVMTDGTVYRFITDHLGSVRLVVNAETGQVVQRMDYDAFGRVLQNVGSLGPDFQPFGFAGGLYDADTGLVRFGVRDYEAYSGRWTAKDPILFDGDQVNLYAYVGNDPVNLVDPTGEIRGTAELIEETGEGPGAGDDLTPPPKPPGPPPPPGPGPLRFVPPSCLILGPLFIHNGNRPTGGGFTIGFAF